MPAGRPTKYKPEFCEQARKLCLLGATDVEMADFFGVTEKTFNNWKNGKPEFLQSLKDAKEFSDSQVEKSLYQRALGYSCPEDKVLSKDGEHTDTVRITKHYPPDVTAAIFWLKNRKRDEWRDKQEHGFTDKDGKDLMPFSGFTVDTTRKGPKT